MHCFGEFLNRKLLFGFDQLVSRLVYLALFSSNRCALRCFLASALAHCGRLPRSSRSPFWPGSFRGNAFLTSSLFHRSTGEPLFLPRHALSPNNRMANCVSTIRDTTPPTAWRHAAHQRLADCSQIEGDRQGARGAARSPLSGVTEMIPFGPR
jgi:hypothetical protein